MESIGESFGVALRDLLGARQMSAKALAARLTTQLQRPVSCDAVEGWVNESDAAPGMQSVYLDAICVVLHCNAHERERLALAQQWSRLNRALQKEGLNSHACLRMLTSFQETDTHPHNHPAPVFGMDVGAQWMAKGVRLSTEFQFRKALESFAIAEAATSAPDTIALITAHRSAALNALNQWREVIPETTRVLALLNMKDCQPSQPQRREKLMSRLHAGDLFDHRLQAYALLTKVQIDLWHHASDFNRAQHCCDTLELVVDELADPSYKADLAQLRSTTLYERATQPAFGSGRVVEDIELLGTSLGLTRRAIGQRPPTDLRGRGMDHRQRARTLLIRNNQGDAEQAEDALREAEISLKHSPAKVSLILEQARAAIAAWEPEQAISYLETARVLAWEIESPHLIADAALSQAALHHPRTGSHPSIEMARASCVVTLIAWPFDRRAREYRVAVKMFLHDLGATPDDLPAIVRNHRTHFAMLEQLPSTRDRVAPAALNELRDHLARCA